MTTTFKFTEDESDSFSLDGSSSAVEIDEQSENANGGTEMMKYGLHDRLPDDIKDACQIICSRVRKVDEDRPTILWLHDMFNDPESAHLADAESRKRFEKLVFVSHWQWTTYRLAMGIKDEEAIVLRNAIEPIIPHKKSNPKDGIRLIYHTTPHRGLEILVPVFDFLSNHYKNIHLDVYSSFEAYGWPQRDEPYKPLFKMIEDHPQMTYHGYQPNDVVRKALQEAHIFAYPSIWEETSCISAIEAMSAGCSVVTPFVGALPETTGNFAYSYQAHSQIQDHANIFVNVLGSVIEIYENNDPGLQNRLDFQKSWTDNFYNWENRVREWEGLIRAITTTKNS